MLEADWEAPEADGVCGAWEADGVCALGTVGCGSAGRPLAAPTCGGGSGVGTAAAAAGAGACRAAGSGV
eukprot:4244515-Alexandrium_andersonii.AAC.1